MDRFQLHPLTDIFLFNSFPIYNLLVGFGLIIGILLFERNVREIDDSIARKDDAVVYFSILILVRLCDDVEDEHENPNVHCTDIQMKNTRRTKILDGMEKTETIADT